MSLQEREGPMFRRLPMLCLALAPILAGCPEDPGGAGSGSVCNDGVAQEGEACDQSELKGQTCEGLGLGAGVLRCNETCDGFDTRGCGSRCGDGVVRGETCDGAELNGATCDTLGFGTGTLGCLPNCQGYDTSRCGAPPSCGDGVRTGVEACDGDDFGGRTCKDYGYDSGPLACRTDCIGILTTACRRDCTAHGSARCDSGHVYWFDSCGNREERLVDCGGLGCSGAQCNRPGQDGGTAGPDSGWVSNDAGAAPDSGLNGLADGGTDPFGLCEGITCSGHGTCVSTSGLAVCDCLPGFHPDGLLHCLPDGEPCAGIACEVWEHCLGGSCLPKDGYCNTKEDCPGGVCGPTHECLSEAACSGVTCSGHGACVLIAYGSATQPTCNCHDGYEPRGLECVDLSSCEGVWCPEWKECDLGRCALRPGHCESAYDCVVPDVCDETTHTCTEDLCAQVSCGNGGQCAIAQGRAICLCPHAFRPDGLRCVPDTSMPSTNAEGGWCGIQWPDRAHPIEVEVGAPPPNVYGRIYVRGVTEAGQAPASFRAELGVTAGRVTYPVPHHLLTWLPAAFNADCAGCQEQLEYVAPFPTERLGFFEYLYRFSTNDGASWWYCDATPNFVDGPDTRPGFATVRP